MTTAPEYPARRRMRSRKSEPLPPPPLDAKSPTRRDEVLVHLAGLAHWSGPQEVTAQHLADAYPDTPRTAWAAVLEDMTRVGPPPDYPRFLYRTPRRYPDAPQAYALAPGGWQRASWLTGRTTTTTIPTRRAS